MASKVLGKLHVYISAYLHISFACTYKQLCDEWKKTHASIEFARILDEKDTACKSNEKVFENIPE